MPDTPGKRQRDAVKTRRRQIKEEKRAARRSAREDPQPPANGEQANDDRPIDEGARPDDDSGPQD